MFKFAAVRSVMHADTRILTINIRTDRIRTHKVLSLVHYLPSSENYPLGLGLGPRQVPVKGRIRLGRKLRNELYRL